MDPVHGVSASSSEVVTSTEVTAGAPETKARKSMMPTGLLARMADSGAVTEPVSSLQQLAEANLNEVLAAAIAKANRVCVLPEGAAPDFAVEEEEQGQLG